MSALQTYPFNNSADYNKTNVEVTGSQVNLLLTENPGQVFSQEFNDDTGFTYDNTKAEFTGGLVRQKDQRPTDGVLGATYTSSKDLNWSTAGSLVGTDIGTPVLSGGKLQCFGGGNNAVRYENADIGASGNVGAIRIQYTPQYSGTPAANYNIFEFAPTSGNADRMLVLHSASGGTLRLTAYTSAGTVKYTAVAFGAAWSPVAGTEYELELNWDTIAGQVRLFVNGVLQGSMAVSSYARGNAATRLYIGAGTVYTATDAAFNDVLLFSTVQHTSGYTAGYSVPEYSFLANKVDGPNFTYTGVGTVLSVDDGSTIETGSPRYIIGGQYWNGSAWVASNGSYAQANSFAVALDNFTEFDTGGGGVLPWSVVFDNSNTQSSVDEFSVEVTGEKYFAIGHLEPVSPIPSQAVLDYTQTTEVNGSTQVKVALKIDGVLKYWNGSAWVNSNGTEAQSNNVVDFNAGLDALELGSNSEILIRWILITSSNTDTPSLSESTVEYDFGAIASEAATCLVYGYVRDLANNPLSGATVKFTLNQKTGVYAEANHNIIDKAVTVTTDVNGYFESPLIRSSEFEDEVEYQVKITGPGLNTRQTAAGAVLSFSVPDAETKDITDLLPPS
jgi:hypothetical protein